ncbi:ABC transporter ATP-binding protein [Planotetraspora kaengkrachanensis]|uniref:ABC transporter ATP-binding protein n=1 Tax=Planotetraspora kaengkrachanensis TaxID=575193 RepID=A0A8J3LTX8_9ACTN|nr:ABC transporter ATP-binding protein [Planotetraspora kaengkrachanensis]GIG77729.1 ABC transporter ATP-binding protein [Planotetraspora kaengkrachanensis]
MDKAIDQNSGELPGGDEGPAPALRLKGLHKVFADNTAVDHVDLVVPRGSFFGLVGPNGAGKTTALSMAVGLLRPDEGRSEVFGVDVWSDPVQAKSLMGVLPDGLAMPERLTGRELLTFIGQLRGIADDVLARRTQDLLNVMELNDAERTLVVDYSTGMRKKIGLATALLHGPRLLVLDEPFEAVDPVSAAALKAILGRFVASGGSVILSSHVMPLVEQLCDTVAVMAKGRLVAAGPLDEVRGDGSLEETFVRLVGVEAGAWEELSWLAS